MNGEQLTDLELEGMLRVWGGSLEHEGEVTNAEAAFLQRVYESLPPPLEQEVVDLVERIMRHVE
jgi:hypothetical protein